MNTRKPTQKDMFYAAGRNIGAANEAFMDMLKGPNPLTPEEIDRFIARRPERWARLAGFGAKAKAAKEPSQ